MITAHINDFVNYDTFKSPDNSEVPYFYTDAIVRPSMQLPPRFAFYDQTSKIPIRSTTTGTHKLITSKEYKIPGREGVPLLSDIYDFDLPVRIFETDNTNYPTRYKRGEVVELTTYNTLIFSTENKVELIDGVFVQRVGNEIMISSENDFYVDNSMEDYQVNIPGDQWLPKSEMNFPSTYSYSSWEPATVEQTTYNFSRMIEGPIYLSCGQVIITGSPNTLLDFMHSNIIKIEKTIDLVVYENSAADNFANIYVGASFFSSTSGTLSDYLYYYDDTSYNYLPFANSIIEYTIDVDTLVFSLPYSSTAQVPNRNLVNIPFETSTIGEIDIHGQTNLKFKNLFIGFSSTATTTYSVMDLFFIEEPVFELLNLRCFLSSDPMTTFKLRDVFFFNSSNTLIRPYFANAIRFDNQIDSFYNSAPQGCSSILSIPFYYDSTVRRVQKIKFTNTMIKIFDGLANREFGRCRLFRDNFCHLKAVFSQVPVKFTTAANGDFYKIRADLPEEANKLFFGDGYTTTYTLGNYLYPETFDNWNDTIVIPGSNPVTESDIIFDPNNAYTGLIVPFLKIWIENSELKYRYALSPDIFVFTITASANKKYKVSVKYLIASDSGDYNLESINEYSTALEGFKKIIEISFNVRAISGYHVGSSSGYPIVVIKYVVNDLSLNEQILFVPASVDNDELLNAVNTGSAKFDFDTEQYGHHDVLLQIVSGNIGYKFVKAGKWAHVDNNCNFVMRDFTSPSLDPNARLISENDFNNTIDKKYRHRIDKRGQVPKLQPDNTLYAYNMSSVHLEKTTYNRPNLRGTILEMLRDGEKEIHIYWGNDNFQVSPTDYGSSRKYCSNNSYYINQKLEPPIGKKDIYLKRLFPSNSFIYENETYYFYEHSKTDPVPVGTNILAVNHNATIRKMYIELHYSLGLINLVTFDTIAYFSDDFRLLMSDEPSSNLSKIYYSKTKLNNMESEEYKLHIKDSIWPIEISYVYMNTTIGLSYIRKFEA